MNSVLVLKTEITSTTVEFISEYLKNEKSKTVAICNANTLVRSYRNSAIQEKINSFDIKACLLYTSPSPRDNRVSRMPSSA